MQLLTAPDEKPVAAPSLFLAGGISNCADWQGQMAQLLANTGLTLINPRRANFDTGDFAVTEAQIRWEYRYLREASALLFWFPPETLCPITLFELGGALERDAPVFVGCDPGYARHADVLVQVGLARPGLGVADSLAALAERICLAFQ